MCFFLEILSFSNEGNGCLLEASIYHSNHKNKVSTGNFMQILSFQLSGVLCSVLQLFGELILLRRALVSSEKMPGFHKLSIKATFTQLKVQCLKSIKTDWINRWQETRGMELTQESCPVEPWKEKVQWIGNHPFFPKLLWEAVTPELLQGLFCGTWVAALLSCTNTILCCIFQLLAA